MQKYSNYFVWVFGRCLCKNIKKHTHKTNLRRLQKNLLHKIHMWHSNMNVKKTPCTNKQPCIHYLATTGQSVGPNRLLLQFGHLPNRWNSISIHTSIKEVDTRALFMPVRHTWNDRTWGSIVSFCCCSYCRWAEKFRP